MFCHKCGTKIPDDGIFCPKCGTQIEIGSIKSTLSIVPQVKITQQTIPSPLAVDPTYAPVLSFIGLFSPKGRRSNGKAFIVGLVTMLLFYGIAIFIGSTSNKKLILFLMFIPLFIIYIGAINLVKRLHDINCTGYWVFLWISLWIIPVAINVIKSSQINGTSSSQNYIPLAFWLVHLAVALFITIKSGTIGSNQYGSDPTDIPIESLDAPSKD